MRCMTCDPPCEPCVSKYYSIIVILPPRWKKKGTNSNAGFTAQTLVTPLCNSMHVAAKLVRSKHIPAMPKQALLTAAHFSCALKFNSLPPNPPAALPLPPAAVLPNRGSLLTSVISNNPLFCMWSRRSSLRNWCALPTEGKCSDSSETNHSHNYVVLCQQFEF